MKQARSSYRLTQTILKNLAKPRSERTEAEVFAGLSEEVLFEERTDLHEVARKVVGRDADQEVSILEARVAVTLNAMRERGFRDGFDQGYEKGYNDSSEEPEACCECHLSKSEFREGPVLRCLRCQKALCFLCTGVHLDCRNRCEEAK